MAAARNNRLNPYEKFVLLADKYVRCRSARRRYKVDRPMTTADTGDRTIDDILSASYHRLRLACLSVSWRLDTDAEGEEAPNFSASATWNHLTIFERRFLGHWRIALWATVSFGMFYRSVGSSAVLLLTYLKTPPGPIRCPLQIESCPL